MSDFVYFLEQSNPKKIKVNRKLTVQDVATADMVVSFSKKTVSRTKIFVLRAVVVKNRWGPHCNLNREDCLHLREFVRKNELELTSQERKFLEILCGESPQ